MCVCESEMFIPIIRKYIWKAESRHKAQDSQRETQMLCKGTVPLRGRSHVTKVSACVVSPNSPLTKLLTTEWRVSGLVT